MIPQPTHIYHITSIHNLAPIVQGGGLQCHNRLHQSATPYTSIAYPRLQERRADTKVPCGPRGTLHDYVPFFFAARPPMLYAISRGNVEEYTEGQAPLIYLVTTVQAIHAAGRHFVFTDGHAIMAYTKFYTDLAQLEQIDWVVMQARIWKDTKEDMDRLRRRQAEFLVHAICPWTLIRGIGVYNAQVRDQVAAVLAEMPHQPVVGIRREWYY